VRFVIPIALAITALALAGPSLAQEPEGAALAAPGVYCKQAGASKKKAEGQKKSPFAECVVGQAKARSGKSPREACSAASKKHVKGQKRTSFATCVVAAQNVSADKKAQEESASTQS
jgi:hypothetical protein